VKTTTPRITAIAAAVAFGLTGCAGGSQAADPKVTTPAKPLTTRAPSPNTTNASTAPPGTSPAQTSQETAAIALVRAYVDEYNNALQSGSTTAFRDTFNKRCALCFGDARRIDEYTRSSRTINGGAFTLIAPKAIRMSSGQILVQAELSQAAARIMDKNGHTLDKFAVVPRFGFTWTTKPVPEGTLVIVDSVPS